MHSKAVDNFVQCLVKGLCLKFSQKDDETPAGKFCDELLKFSRHFEDDILEVIYKIPAEVLTIEGIFLKFLHLICSDICTKQVCNVETDERKFLFMCGFILNVAILSFSVPCYRLMRNIKTVLISQLKTNLSLNLDSDARAAFENLEGKCLRLASKRCWVRRRLEEFKEFIPQALDSCNVKAYQPNVASLLLHLNEFGISIAENGDSSPNEACSFCATNCKSILETFLN